MAESYVIGMDCGTINIKADAIGHELVDAHSKADEDIRWFGENGACPVCHCDLITFNGTTKVECPVCGIEGTMEIDGGEVKIVFPKAQQDRARGTFAGLREHTTEIQGFGAICGPKIMANKEFLGQGDGRTQEVRHPERPSNKLAFSGRADYNGLRK